MSSLDYLELCRLCLVKERVSVPIFEGEGDVRQIFLKIAACLPVKVNREDKLPKKICDDCVYKVELFYQFWNTTANAEKQLLQWLGEVNLEDKQGYVTNVVNPVGMKPDQNTKNRLDGSVMQQVDEQQNNMGIGMMDNMGLGLPMMMPNANQQQITSVPMDSSGNSAQTVQAVPGPSTQTAHSQIQQNQTSTTQQEEEEEESEEDENSDDECDGDEGLPVKEEGEEDPNRTIEPTTFVNVSLACDEAGPSGLQQQKIPEMPEMAIPQTPDGDPKSGAKPRRKGVIVQDDTGRLRLVLIRSKDADDMKAKRLKLENGFEEIKTESLEGGNDQENEELVQLKPKKPPQIIIKTLKPLPQKLASQYLVSKQPLKKVTVFQSVLKNTTLPITDIKTLKSEKLDGDWSKSPTLEAIEDDVDDILNSLQTTCPICEKVFDTPNKLNSHVKKAHRPPYKCNQCDDVFHTEERLELHKASHQQERVFECDICHMKWRLEKSMKNHKLRCHSDENAALFMCEYCGKSYHLEKDLEYHIKRSHERKLDICRYCGKSVKSIRGHEWRHQQQNGNAQTVYPCHLCRKKFYDQDRLARHLVRHENGLKCEDCGKVYPGKQELGNHRRYKHSLSNFLKCVVCEKTFAVGYFYLHVLTHAGIRPYKCDICEEDFTQRTSLLRHRRQHPGPLPPEPPSQPQIVYQAKRYLQELENSRMLENLANEEDGEDDTDNVTIMEQDATMDHETTIEEEMTVETVEDIIVEEDTTIDQDIS